MLQKLIENIKTLNDSISIRNNFIFVSKNGISYPIARIYKKHIDLLWIELNQDNKLYIRRDNKGEYEYLERIPFNLKDEVEFEINKSYFLASLNINLNRIKMGV